MKPSKSRSIGRDMNPEHLLTDEQRSVCDMSARLWTRDPFLPKKLQQDYALINGVHQKLVDIEDPEGRIPARI